MAVGHVDIIRRNRPELRNAVNADLRRASPEVRYEQADHHCCLNGRHWQWM
jgi:hypothetical protein